MKFSKNSPPNKSVVRDLLPDLGDLKEFGKQLFMVRDQGPLHRLGLDPRDVANMVLLPRIKRARDFHVYSAAGKRYLDLFRGEGFSLLGYSVPRFKLAIKNRMSQGLWIGMPHVQFKQASKHLERCFPGHHAIICPDRYRVLSVLELMGLPTNRAILPCIDDLDRGPSGSELGYWFPFAFPPSDVSVALLPALGVQGPYILLVNSQIFTRHIDALGDNGKDIGHILTYIGNQVPGYALSALEIALSTLEGLGAFAVGNSQPVVDQRAIRSMNQSLGVWRESDWGRIETGRWKRTGPYLIHSFDPPRYGRAFAFALSEGVLLNPRSVGINCLPGVMSPGEKKLIERILAWDPDSEA